MLRRCTRTDDTIWSSIEKEPVTRNATEFSTFLVKVTVAVVIAVAGCCGLLYNLTNQFAWRSKSARGSIVAVHEGGETKIFRVIVVSV